MVPGNRRQRAISQPSTTLAASTEPTPATKSGQACPISPSNASGMVLAIMQPTMACANTNARGGTRTGVSRAANTMAAAIGPISNAADRCSHWNSPAISTEAATSPPQCAASRRSAVPVGDRESAVGGAKHMRIPSFKTRSADRADVHFLASSAAHRQQKA